MTKIALTTKQENFKNGLFRAVIFDTKKCHDTENLKRAIFTVFCNWK